MKDVRDFDLIDGEKSKPEPPDIRRTPTRVEKELVLTDGRIARLSSWREFVRFAEDKTTIKSYVSFLKVDFVDRNGKVTCQWIHKSRQAPAFLINPRGPHSFTMRQGRLAVVYLDDVALWSAEIKTNADDAFELPISQQSRVKFTFDGGCSVTDYYSLLPFAREHFGFVPRKPRSEIESLEWQDTHWSLKLVYNGKHFELQRTSIVDQWKAPQAGD